MYYAALSREAVGADMLLFLTDRLDYLLHLLIFLFLVPHGPGPNSPCRCLGQVYIRHISRVLIFGSSLRGFCPLTTSILFVALPRDGHLPLIEAIFLLLFFQVHLTGPFFFRDVPIEELDDLILSLL